MTDLESEDAALVARILDGEAAAERELYLRHVGPITNVVARIVGRLHDAEDIVQDVFVHALRDISTLREPAHFRRWIYRIAVHRSRTYLRRRRVLELVGLDRGGEDASLDRLASADAPPEVRAELALAANALRGASAEERIAFVLHVIEGCSLPEVADAIGASLATAKRRVRSAQDRLEKHGLGVAAPSPVRAQS